MDNQTIQLLRHYSERYNTADAQPNCVVEVYRMDGKGGYEPAAFTVPNIIEVSLDRRYNLAASELKVQISNDKGELSPNYAVGKHYDNVKGLQLNGFANVLIPFNKIVLKLGYGDEMRTMFTGQIVNVSIRENPPTIILTCKDMYRKLLKTIDPETKKVLVYENQTAGIIFDKLFDKAGIDNYWFDEKTLYGKEYTFEKKVFNLDTQYSDAIKEIVEMLAHRVYCSREGWIIIEPLKRYTQEEAAKLELNDYVNLTSGEYNMDSAILRNRVIVQANDGWRAFEDLGLIAECNGEKISCGLESPWALDDEKSGEPIMKQAVADRFFMDQRKRFRKITVGAKGHPALDVGDLVKVRELISTANSNYMITGIKTSYSQLGYVDTIDLEYVAADAHIATLAEGQYQNVSGEVDGGDNKVVTMSTRDRIADEALRHFRTLYQYGGDVLHNPNQPDQHYGVDGEHLIWYVYEQFGILNEYHTFQELFELGNEITKEELQKGDLVFYSNDGSPEMIHQVGIYIGDDALVLASGGSEEVISPGVAEMEQAFVKVKRINEIVSKQLYRSLI